MAKYLAITKILLTKFKEVKIEQVRRDLNSHVDALTSLPLIFEGEIDWILAVDLISVPSHKMHQEYVLINIGLGPTWMDPIANFL